MSQELTAAPHWTVRLCDDDCRKATDADFKRENDERVPPNEGSAFDHLVAQIRSDFEYWQLRCKKANDFRSLLDSSNARFQISDPTGARGVVIDCFSNSIEYQKVTGAKTEAKVPNSGRLLIHASYDEPITLEHGGELIDIPQASRLLLEDLIVSLHDVGAKRSFAQTA